MNPLLQSETTRKILLTLSSGVTLSLAYNVPALWFLGFIALVPLLFVLKNSKTIRARFFFPFLTGLCYFGSVFIFLFDAHPITWSQIEGMWTSLALISFTWIVTIILFSIFTGLWGVLSAYVSLNSKIASITTIAGLWVLLEWIQAFSFSLVWWNTSALVGSHWTYGFIGYTLAEFPLLLTFASLGGIYLLSFIVIFFNELLFILFDTQNKTKQSRRTFIIFLCILFTASLSLYVLNSAGITTSKRIRVASIHTTFGPHYFSSPESEPLKNVTVMGLLDRIVFDDEHPDLIILPEDTGYIVSLSDNKKEELFSRLSSATEVMIIDSHRERKPGNKDTSILEYETKDGETETYTKKLLVPAAEYLPKLVEYIGNMFLENNWKTQFEEQIAFTKGEEINIGTLGSLQVGALFCSEVFTPTLYREVTRRGANILVNSASHALLNNSKSAYNQVVKFSKVRAVENNRFFVQSGNIAPSFVISNHGRVIAETAREKNAILYSNIPLIKRKTFATRTGDLWIIVFLLIYTGGILLTIKQKNSKKD